MITCTCTCTSNAFPPHDLVDFQELKVPAVPVKLCYANVGRRFAETGPLSDELFWDEGLLIEKSVRVFFLCLLV